MNKNSSTAMIPHRSLGLREVWQITLRTVVIVLTLSCLSTGDGNAQEFKSMKIKGSFLNIDKDNIIYKRGCVFEYDYYFLRAKDTLKISRNQGINTFEKVSDDQMQINQLLFQIIKPALFGRTNAGQSELTITAINSSKQLLARSYTGLVENKYNVWLHPPRTSLFGILELNPFPYIQFPAAINKEWKDAMTISDHWSNALWKVWEGDVKINYEYKITGQKLIKFRNSEVLCWVIKSHAASRLGKTELVSFFNEKHGFILLNYRNIDGSETNFSLK